ncbi:peptidase domain-containing ABC transporter [Runella slithyformis]|uniref:Xenobiotic-transporting ATPase n=1 Tax=Runella slithyformis (strain ATCC 29530 / DSM 19594 / LMG 11500 / NCIMB 11436 / LSU 4) TaxID=761193 RepID=A0A7U3ZNP5_RUNSL|nr:peptidase domain-containing ABC transporter [Runella slithyformis]AEI50557.1 Xenobiotic-transporting ATPase [Runella slithyformis DSM 19594]
MATKKGLIGTKNLDSPKAMNQKQLEKSFVLQQDSSDCGVACLKTLLRYYGSDASLERLRELSGTTTQGTTLLGLYQAANTLGLEAEGCEADISALREHGAPVALHVLMEGQLQHYVVCSPLTPDGGANTVSSSTVGRQIGFIVSDPARGVEVWSEEELRGRWQSGKCLTIKPTERLSQRKDQQKAKKAWLMSLVAQDAALLAAASVLGLGMALLGMAMAVFSQKLIDEILPARQFTKLYAGIALVAFLLLVRVGLESLRTYILLRQSKQFNNRIIGLFYDLLLALPKAFFDSRKTGDLVARLNDTGRIQRVISQLAGSVLIDLLMVVVTLGFLVYYSWQVGIAVLLALPFYFWLLYRFNKPISDAQRNVMAAYAHNESNYISTLQGVRVIKNFGKQLFFGELNRQVYGTFQENVFKLGQIQIRLNAWASIAGVSMLIATLGFTSWQVLQNQLKTGELMAIVGLVSSLLPSVANLALIAIPINEARIAFERMFEFVGLQPEDASNVEENTSIEIFNSLEINNLSFRFAGRMPLLKNVNLRLERGQIVGLMGESGSGKSTLLQIIEKFYIPESGQVMFNDTIDWNEITPRQWRTLIATVPQEVHLFNGTVLDNILLGNPTTKAEIMDFCQQYGFVNFIESLPQGLATIVGEEGVNLSGGQKQMLALMRALYKRPQLLILDEATSAMDKHTEQFVLGLLESLRSQMAVLSVSHRTDILQKHCDVVYELESGVLNEQLTTSVL